MPRGEGINVSDYIKPTDFIGQRASYFHKGLRNHFEKHDKEKLAEFENCQTDEERVAMVWKSPVLHEMIELEAEWEQKDAEKSSELRTKGNKYFQKKSYLTASDEYTQSMRYAPPETDEGKKNELALSYANRSAAFFHLKKYKLAILDIRQALQHGYPQDMQVKLYERLGKCHTELGQKEEAVQSYRDGLASLTNAALDEKGLEKWTKNMNSQLEDCEQIKEKSDDEERPKYEVPALEATLESHPCITKLATVEHLKEIGRFVKAEEQIDVGKPVIVEKPLCSVLFADYHKTHCYNCYKRVAIGAVPCPQCATVIYCSRECAEPNWEKYHQYECKHLETYDHGYCAKIGHVALRLVMKMGVKPIIEFHRNLKESGSGKNVLNNPERLGCNEVGVYAGDYETFCKLYAGEEGNFAKAVTACALLKLMAASGFLQQDGEDLATEETFCELAYIILFHLRILQCNITYFMEMSKPNDFENPKPLPMGAGVYSSVALLNHSCDPNADLSFHGDTVVARAIRNIPAGIQVSCTYGPVYYEDRFMDRQKRMKEDYFFRCECPACLGRWPIAQLMEDQVPQFRCEECRTAFVSYELEDKKFARCHQCDHRQNLETNMAELYESHGRFKQGMAEAMNGHYTEGLKTIEGHLSLMQRYISPPWRDFTSAQAAVMNCYRLMGNRPINY